MSVCMCVCGVGGYTRCADGTSHESVALYVCECGVCLCGMCAYVACVCMCVYMWNLCVRACGVVCGCMLCVCEFMHACVCVYVCVVSVVCVLNVCVCVCACGMYLYKWCVHVCDVVCV